ncbi:MAG: hypothetical protein ABSA69_05000 [Verrucomicrobiota bacterium]|jgi:hypothetical protein
MKSTIARILLAALLGLLPASALFTPCSLDAQSSKPPVVVGPDAQRNALKSLRSQIVLFQNSTHVAPNYGAAGYAIVWRQFQSLRAAYDSFKSTLTAQQLAAGANDFAELDAGLDVIQEAFTDYQNETGPGYSSPSSFLHLCHVLDRATAVWSQKLETDCSSLRIAG